jgi:hypothetical protein
MTKTQVLNKLLAYCEKQGVELYADHEGYAAFHFSEKKKNKKHLETQIIQYNKFLPKTFLIYSILHELGHRELILEGFEKQYGQLYHKNILELLEEMLAWKRGAEIAKKAKIPINMKGFSKYSSKALRTYIGGLFMVGNIEPEKIRSALDSLL